MQNQTTTVKCVSEFDRNALLYSNLNAAQNAQDRASIWSSGVTTLSGVTPNAIAFGTVAQAPTNNGVSTTATANALTILNAGLYKVDISATFQPAAAGVHNIFANVNGGVSTQMRAYANLAVGGTQTLVISQLQRFARNDVLTLTASQPTAAACQILFPIVMSVVYVGP